MQSAKPRTRLQAFGLHLAISTLIFAALAALIVYRWYPGFFFQTDGGWQGLRIIALVDLVLGPALTLLVYNPRKSARALRFDLGSIAVVQGVCLGIGVYLVQQQRPLALVYAGGAFYSVSGGSFKLYGKDPAGLPLLRGAARGPVWIHVAIPAGQSSLATAWHGATDRYRPFASHASEVLAEGLPAAELQRQGIAAEGYAEHARFYGYYSRYGDYWLALDGRNATPLGVLRIGTLDERLSRPASAMPRAMVAH